MMQTSEAKQCCHCQEDIAEGQSHLVIAGADGTKQFIHSSCFTETTFDPDRFQLIAPDSDGGS
jgi:hypothetical protein